MRPEFSDDFGAAHACGSCNEDHLLTPAMVFRRADAHMNLRKVPSN
jgi:hypothetical protein